MALERLPRSPPQEKSFGQLFPWRNIRRALMLVLLIVAIFVIKRSAQPMLERVGQMWGPPARRPAAVQIRAVVRPGPDDPRAPASSALASPSPTSSSAR
jgi:hypothetical protein